ncbi:MAG: SDH family Clp fold serine proteinase [Alphaproteobacteria bacterium]
MHNNLPLMDQAVFDAVEESERHIERALNCDLLFFYGEIWPGISRQFRNFLEQMVEHHRESRTRKPATLGICLTTPGGSVEETENIVEVMRHHYSNILFLVPNMAMSAGTIFCMSGDRIYMDYSSSLGPIDPQVPDREERYLVPALGYIDKIEELIHKSHRGELSPAEFNMLDRMDLAMIRRFEQARDLSVALLEKWLAAYKFKDWKVHRTTEPGTRVTMKQKRQRAREIALKLADNKHWHSHGRRIGMQTLRGEVGLEIDDFGADPELHRHVRRYNDALSDWLNRRDGEAFFLYNRNVN